MQFSAARVLVVLHEMEIANGKPERARGKSFRNPDK